MKKLTDLQLHNGEIPEKPAGTLSKRDFFMKPTLEPYIVYTILKEKFGPPNGLDIDEEKQQWEWCLSFEDFHISIYDWKVTSTSLVIYHKFSDNRKSQELATRINELLEAESIHKKRKLKSKVKDAKHKIIENPFYTYYSTAVGLIEYAEFIDEATITKNDEALANPNDGLPEKIAKNWEFWEKRDNLHRSAFLMLLSSFEGFLNLVYELYLLSEMREDRIFSRIGREQIDIKLRLVPTYCQGFKVKTINHEDTRFKNYVRLINLRNDYVHANLVKRLERYVVEEDNYTFIIENEENSDIPTNFGELGPEHVCRLPRSPATRIRVTN